MNGSEQHDDALRDVLHHTVDHIHASPDLAQRVERAARHRRTIRGSATGALALAAVATCVLASVHQAAAPTYATSQVQPPACAASQTAYRHTPVSGNSTPTHAATGPVVPGSPIVAVVCRYGENGVLAASATVTDHAQLGRLQAVLNASQAYTGTVNCGEEATGLKAVIAFAYPRGTGDLTVTYDGACGSLYTDSGSYFVRGDVYALITAWTGNSRNAASPSTS